MRRNQSKKRRIQTAAVGKTTNEGGTLKVNAPQDVPSSITKSSHHPLEKLSWIAAILSLFVALFALVPGSSWFFQSKQNSFVPANTPDQHLSISGPPATGKEESSPTIREATKSPSSGANPDEERNRTIDHATLQNPSKPRNESKVAGHLARAHSLSGQKRYSAALAECDRALQLDGANQKAQALRTKIAKILTAEILEENDKPKH